MNQPEVAVKDEVHMTGTSQKELMWFNGKEFVPFETLSAEELQKALLRTQKLELKLFNRMGKFAEIMTRIDQEAETRGIKLVDYNSDYHKNKRKT